MAVTSGEAATLYVDDVSVRDDGDAYVPPGAYVRMYAAELIGEQKYEYNIDSAGFVVGSSFTLTDPGVHTVVYRALDHLNHQEPDVETQIVVDTSGPTGSISINGGAQYTTSTNVTLTLSASDPAGVAQMRIQSDSGVWGSWEPYWSSKSYTLTSPGEGTKTLSVQYEDEFGNIGDVYSDSIEYLIPDEMDIPGAKMVPDGDGVSLPNKIVTAIFPSSGYFYIQEPDRRSGIRVRLSNPQYYVSITTSVTVEGVTDTVYAEREIIATDIGRGDPVDQIRPLGMTNRSLGGGDFYYQPGVPGSSGLNNVGLLVTTTGRVVRVFAGTFYIDDGSPIVDSWPPYPAVLIDNQAPGFWIPALDSYVSVTGISGMSTLGDSPIRILRPRTGDDVGRR